MRGNARVCHDLAVYPFFIDSLSLVYCLSNKPPLRSPPAKRETAHQEDITMTTVKVKLERNSLSAVTQRLPEDARCAHGD